MSVEGLLSDLQMWELSGAALCRLEVNRTVLLRLRADALGVVKEASQGVDLCGGDGEHDKQVQAGPEGHPPQVVLQKVAVPCLKGPQHGLDLAAPFQVLVHRVHPRLEEEEKNSRQEEMKESARETWREIVAAAGVMALLVSLSP